MKKIFILLLTFLFLTGCYQSMALLGPAVEASNGKFIKSSFQSIVNQTIKKQTGKSVFEHMVKYPKK